MRKFDITEWTAYTFVRNMYDLWLPKHFERICDIIDMLPADLNFDVSEQDFESVSARSGLSQRLGKQLLLIQRSGLSLPRRQH